MGLTGSFSTTFFLVLGIAVAQTATWEQLINTGTDLKTKGRYAEAEAAFRSALEKAEASATPAAVASTANDLGILLEIRGDYSHAEEFLLKSVSIFEALPESLSLAVALHNLGNVYGEEGQLDRAEPLCRRALDIQVRLVGPEGPGVPEILDGIGNLQFYLSEAFS